MKKTILVFCVILVLSLASCLNFENDTLKTFKFDDFEYTIDNGNATITKYTGNAYCVLIPEIMDGYKVTSIAQGAFVKQTVSLLSHNEHNSNDVNDMTIYIPSSVEHIEENAFNKNGNIYVTDSTHHPKGWKDSSLKGDAQDDSDLKGNVYFDVYQKDCLIIDGIFYFYNKKNPTKNPITMANIKTIIPFELPFLRFSND